METRFVTMQAKDLSPLAREQKESRESTLGKYDGETNFEIAELSERAVTLGKNIFVPIAQRKELPGKSHDTAERRFLVESEDVLGFQGVAGKDLSKLFHLLLIPSYRNNEINRDTEELELKWVFDLGPEHICLLEHMRDVGLEFVRTNRKWFREVFADYVFESRALEYWLREENIQFGFHSCPSIGYLHMHVLVGPVTEFGFETKYQESWVPLELVLDVVHQGMRMSSMLNLQDSDKEERMDSCDRQSRRRSWVSALGKVLKIVGSPM